MYIILWDKCFVLFFLRYHNIISNNKRLLKVLFYTIESLYLFPNIFTFITQSITEHTTLSFKGQSSIIGQHTLSSKGQSRLFHLAKTFVVRFCFRTVSILFCINNHCFFSHYPALEWKIVPF